MSFKPLQFVPFDSCVTPAFWSAFAKVKLEGVGLDESPLPVVGFFVNSDSSKKHEGLPVRMTVEWDAFRRATPCLTEQSFATGDSMLSGNGSHWATYSVNGRVINKNTLESFKTCNKMDVLQRECSLLWEDMGRSVHTNGDPQPYLLNRFCVLMYADLKKYHYYYWFAFPSFKLPSELGIFEGPTPIAEAIGNPHHLLQLYSALKKSSSGDAAFFWIQIEDRPDSLNQVKAVLSLEQGLLEHHSNTWLAFADPSTLADVPGWPLRNLLALVWKLSMKHLVGGLKVVSFRQNVVEGGQISISDSFTMTVKFHPDQASQLAPTEMPDVVGWEKNEKGYFGPRLANMRSSMDPRALASSSVDLNLKLMKWRMVPNLDLVKIASSKCLLLGAGTLGCNVARCLLGWGVRNITFVDNGKVSFSNPVRQTLFGFKDCLNGGRLKAEAAAESLQSIFPMVNSSGVCITVPMPAHPIIAASLPQVRRDYDNLEELIKSHDVVFLLTDTRESRWLPTAMAGLHQKLVINAALGFDSYLVMRHGARPRPPFQAQSLKTQYLNQDLAGSKLGCYFCNDVVAPGNSTTDRTLDQQCTVTRPGASFMAAALAVELMVSVMQHPLGLEAPAPLLVGSKSSGESGDGAEASSIQSGLCDVVPHSIRGSLSTFSQFRPTTEMFLQCTACSEPVLDQLASRGFDFVAQVAEDSNALRDTSGLSKLLADVDLQGPIEFSDCDSDE